jgi:hypothetical protein
MKRKAMYALTGKIKNIMIEMIENMEELITTNAHHIHMIDTKNPKNTPTIIPNPTHNNHPHQPEVPTQARASQPVKPTNS